MFGAEGTTRLPDVEEEAEVEGEGGEGGGEILK